MKLQYASSLRMKINQKSHSKNEKLEHGYEKQVVITSQGDTLIPTSKIDVFWHK
jgi:hypothetical protein